MLVGFFIKVTQYVNNLVQESEMSFQSLAFKCWQVRRSWKLVVAIAGSMQIFRCSQAHCCPPQVRHNQDGPTREIQS